MSAAPSPATETAKDGKNDDESETDNPGDGEDTGDEDDEEVAPARRSGGSGAGTYLTGWRIFLTMRE